MSFEIIRDPLWNNIRVDALALRLVDTAAFQRLRYVRQLGLAYLVYPGASHTRFEHALGAYHLAGRALAMLEERDGPRIERREAATIVRYAALLHDIGHYPYSHALEEIGALHHEEVARPLVTTGPVAEVLRQELGADAPARIMSLIFTIFLFTPIYAPFLGIAILSFASWQAVFFTPPMFALIVFIWSLRMEESLPRDKRTSLDLKSLSRLVIQVMTNKVFVRYTLITTLLFTGLSSYVASSEHIVGEIYSKPKLFPWIFGGIGLVMSACSYINSHLSSRFGARKSIRSLLIIYTIVAGVLLLFTLMFGDPPNISVFFVGICLLLSINLAVEPNSSALALEPMGNMAGMASAVYGTFFFFVGAAVGSVVSRMMATSVSPLVVSFFAFGAIAVILVLSDRRKV